MALVDPTAWVRVACAPSALLDRFPSLVGDAVLVSDLLVQMHLFTSAAVYHSRLRVWELPVARDQLTRDIPNASEEALAHLDARGIVKVGSTVSRGDILVGMVGPQAPMTAEERLRRNTFGWAGEDWPNKSLVYLYQDSGLISAVELQAQRRGRCLRCGDVALASKGQGCPYCNDVVQEVRQDRTLYGEPRRGVINYACVRVEYVIRRELRVGDILRDRDDHLHTVAAILPQDQIRAFSGELGVSVLVHPTSELARSLSRERPDRVGKTKYQIQHDQVELVKVTVRREQKLLARGAGHEGNDYHRSTQTPLSCETLPPGQVGTLDAVSTLLRAGEGPGRSGRASRVTPDVVSALLRAGYPCNLLEMLTVKSDDMDGRRSAAESLMAGKPLLRTRPEASSRLETTLRACCFDVCLPSRDANGAPSACPDTLPIVGATHDNVLSWSCGEVKKPETINYRTYRPEKDGLFCERIFGPEQDWECTCGKYREKKYKGVVCDKCGVKITESRDRRKRMGHIELAAPVVHPWFFRGNSTLSRLLDISPEALDRIIACIDRVVTEAGTSSFRPGERVTMAQLEAAHKGGATFRTETGGEAILALMPFREKEKWAWLLLKAIPVLPPELRPDWLDDAKVLRCDPLNNLYGEVIKSNRRVASRINNQAPEGVLSEPRRRLQEAVDALFGDLTGSDKQDACLATTLSEAVRGLLEKTTDYSASVVAVPDAAIPSGSIGLPPTIAIHMFEPLIVRVLKEAGFADTLKGAKQLIERHSGTPEVQRALTDALASRRILVITEKNQTAGLQPVLRDGEVARLHPEDGSKLELTFGGDKISLHLPISQAALRELSYPRPPSEVTSGLSGLTPLGVVETIVSGTPVRLHLADRIALGVADLECSEAPRVTVSFAKPLEPPEPLGPPRSVREMWAEKKAKDRSPQAQTPPN